jgi:hypothetical protein
MIAATSVKHDLFHTVEGVTPCTDGTVRIGFTPEVGAETQSQTQKGSWTIVSGTGAFDQLAGGGKSEAVYGTNPSSPVRETLTGTVLR